MKKFFALLALVGMLPLLPANLRIKNSQELKSYPVRDFSSLLEMADFSSDLLKMHFKLYEGYVKNTNYLLSQLHTLSTQGKANSYEFGALKRRLGWEFDGMRLHEYYFENLSGKSPINKKSRFYQAVIEQFGSFNAWREDFIATGAIRGIGWAIVYLDLEEGRLVNTWINEHDVGHLAEGKLILVMDVFEHAYITQFGLDRKKYMEIFFNNVDWEVVEKRYVEATQRREWIKD